MSRAIGVVRVSRVNGREGDSFASPVVQRERIETACTHDGLELLDVLDELDVSGGLPLAKRPGLLSAVEAIEAGRASTLMVGYFDRLARSLSTQHEVCERVEAAGGQVIAVDVGRVGGNATRKLQANILGSMSEWVRNNTKEKSEEAQALAVERGVIPWPNIPPGLRLCEDGTVEPDTEPFVSVVKSKRTMTRVEVVQRAFEMRAEEATVKEVRLYLKAHGVERTWHGCQAMLKSRLFLGELVFGKLLNETACVPIVDRAVWSKAQRTEIRGPKAKSNRLLARQGVLRCGTCGGRMVVGTQTQNGRKYGFYRCSPLGDCERRAAIGAEIVEAVVVEHVRAALADVEGQASAEQNARDAERDLARAQEKLDGAILSLADLMAEPAAVETLTALREARDAAQKRVDRIGGGPTLTVSTDDWDSLSLDARRRLVKLVVETATVAPGKGADRITVQLLGQ